MRTPTLEEALIFLGIVLYVLALSAVPPGFWMG
jgi:hypothetical protein